MIRKIEKILCLLFLFFCHCTTSLTTHSLKESTASNEKKNIPNSKNSRIYEKDQQIRKNACDRKSNTMKATVQEKALFTKICYSIHHVAEKNWVSDEEILAYMTTIHHSRLSFLKRTMHPEFSALLLRSLASENSIEQLVSCVLLDRLLFNLSKDEYKQYVSSYVDLGKRNGNSVKMFFKGKTHKILETFYAWSLIHRAITNKRIPIEWKYSIKEQIYLEYRAGNESMFTAYEFFEQNEQ